MDFNPFKSVRATQETVQEKNMDPVNKAELKGKHADRKDKDINNDGKVNDTDKYLHARRKAVSKAVSNEGVYKDMDTEKSEPSPRSDDKVKSDFKKRRKSEKNDVAMNPKLDKGTKDNSMEQKESRIRTALKSVLEGYKDAHNPNADKAEKAKDNRKGKGAEDMMADADKEIEKGPDAHLNEPEIDKENFKKMTSNVKTAAKRKNDNPKGDTKIVPAGTQFKDPATMKPEESKTKADDKQAGGFVKKESYDNMSALKDAYASMYATQVEEEDEIEESYTHEVDYAEDGAHTAKKFVATAKKAGIKAKIHDPRGPGGGHPVVHLGHKDEDHIHKFLKKHHSPDTEKDDVKAYRI